MKIPFHIPVESHPDPESVEHNPVKRKSSFFSSLSARIFFLLLLLGDILWSLYALVLLMVSLLGLCVTCAKLTCFKDWGKHALLSLKRSLVCGIALFVALFSPAFGIMIACTYFLMYDRSGIEEVVPVSLQNQFKEFLHKENDSPND